MTDRAGISAGGGGQPSQGDAPSSPSPRAATSDQGVSGETDDATLESASLDTSPRLITETRIAGGVPSSVAMFSGAPRRGDRIGENNRFEIIEKLGEGGMGHVFRASDWHLDRTVAVKFILQTQDMPLGQLVTQLKREAKVTAKLNHENIVAIFDMDAFNGVPFLVMELLDGQSLDVMMESSQLAPLRATRIMAQVARGLMHAHANAVVHRDLKPSNVFILRDGRAKILDFGISRFERPIAATIVPSDLAPTIFGAGTPAYMAPEQWRSDPQDGRTDIWAAGVMFYQMLTGKLPYGVPELLGFRSKRRVRSVAPSAKALVSSLPDEADRIIATALNEDPEGRYQSARELWEALRELEHMLAGTSSESAVVSAWTPRVERRPLTLLACSLEGVDPLDLDEVIEADLRFYDACATAVKQWGGVVGTPIGGRLLCCFGYPAARETDAQHAIRAGLQIATKLRDPSGPAAARIEFKLAIHSGIVGLPNSPNPGGLPAMQGHVPNVAGELRASAPPNAVTISQTTRNLTSTQFSSELVPESGARAVRAFTVTGEIESASRFEQTFAAHLTPFVGREHELALLHQLWQEAKDGRGQLVVVRGDAGIGKSRIVQTLKNRVIEESKTRLTCQCRPHFKNTALRPIVELMLRSMDVQRDDSPEVKLEKLERSLASQGFEVEEAVPLFGPLLSIPFEEKYLPQELSPEQRKVKTLESLASMLLRMALENPVLFIIEDLHWVDHSTIEFLNALIDLVPASRLLVVLTCRPEFRPPWSARRHLHAIELDRLSAEVAVAMIRRAAEGRDLPDEMIERLVATTDGVPLFVEELTRMVVESWSNEPGSTTQTKPEPARVDIPNTLHELLLARLDRLRGLGKEVAQLGAVLGRDFGYPLIRHVSPLDELSLQEGLEILTRAGVLHRQGVLPEAKFMFKHALIQQTAYQSLVKSERREHHKRTAEVLEEVFTDTTLFEPELLAHHHAEAGNLEEALAYWEKAGQQATQRSGLVEAVDHYQRALNAIESLSPGPDRDKRELGLLLALGSPLMSVQGYAAPAVEKNYARARELARAAGAQGEVFPAMQGLWQFYYVRGKLPASRALGEQLLEIAEESQNSTFLLLAHRAVASSAFLQGDYEPCRVHTQAGMKIYNVEAHGSLALRTGHDPGVAHGVYQAWTLWMLGYPDRSLDTVIEMVELARRLAHPMTIAYALCFAALMRNHRGDHAEALLLSQEALSITTANKFALWTAWATMQRGWALAGMGDLERGIPQMSEGLQGWEKTGARVGFTFFPVTLAEMCLRAGQLVEAEELLTGAEPMIAENDEHFYEPELRRLKAELARAKSSLDGSGSEANSAEIMAEIQAGLDVARTRQGKSWELRLNMTRSRLLAELGETQSARRDLKQVLDWFEEGHDTADLMAAQEQLGALGASA